MIFFNCYNSKTTGTKELKEAVPLYGNGWKIKYFDLLERHNALLESKIEAYVLSTIDDIANSAK